MSLTDITRLWIATFLLYAATGAVFPIFPIYMSSRGLSPSQIGLVVSVATLSSIVPIVLIGHFSDVMNREKVQGIIGIGLALLIPAYIYLRALFSFMAMHSAYVALAYSYMTLSGAIAMDYIRTSRGSGFGKFRTSGALGWILGTFLGGWITENVGFLVAFITSSLFFWTSALLFYIGGRGKKLYAQGGKAFNSLRIEAFKKALTNSAVYSLLLAIFIASLTTPAYYTFLPLYMTKRLGASRFISSLAFTITPVAEVPAMIYIGALSDRVGRRKIITLCLAAYPARYTLTVLVGRPELVILVQLLHGLTFGGLYVVSTAYLSDSVPEDMKGLTLSLYTIFMNLGSFVGNYMMGFIVEKLGYEIMYFTAATISLLSIPTLITFSRRR
ncbi:MAG: hypothetical protein DRN15_03800 [Thermoprotei archaeon]|nr:MAG: hypothetical protein DRM97_04245 [Thermoprotei archaeon]RLF24249.1 MAG: hypothetical protein DRN15_03800 [Thermoprotei archaeon]